MNELKPCPFCGVMPIPDSGSVLYELHHKPNCFLGARIRFGYSELERWNTRHDSELIATQLALKEAGEASLKLSHRLDMVKRGVAESIELIGLNSALKEALSNPLTQQALSTDDKQPQQ